MRKSILVLLAAAALIIVATITGAQNPVPLRSLPFSPARKAGPTLYVSGQIARTPDGQDVRGSVEAETRQVMENIGRILREQGYSFDDVVNATVYLADLNDYQAMNQAYASYFKNGFPARACVGGVSLRTPEP